MRTQQAWLNLPGGSKQQQRDRQRTWKHKYGGGRAEAQQYLRYTETAWASMPLIKTIGTLTSAQDISQRLLEVAKAVCDAAGYVTHMWRVTTPWETMFQQEDLCSVAFRFDCPCGEKQDLIARWPLAGIQRDAPEGQIRRWADEIKLELDRHVAGEA